MQMIIKTTHNELETISELLAEADSYAEPIMIESEDFGDDRIITCGALYVLEDLGISVIEGQYCVYNTEEEHYEPDFSVTIIYATASVDDIEFNHYTYWEQDPPLTAVHNYLNLTRKDS